MNPLTIALLLTGATVTAVALTRRSGETGRPRPGEDVPVGTPPPAGTGTAIPLDDPRFAAFRAASTMPRAPTTLLSTFYNDPRFDASDFTYAYRNLRLRLQNEPEQYTVWLLNPPSAVEQPSEQVRKRALRGLAAILRSNISPLQVDRALSTLIRAQLDELQATIAHMESPNYRITEPVNMTLTALEQKYGLRFDRPPTAAGLLAFLVDRVPQILRQQAVIYQGRLSSALESEDRAARSAQYRQPLQQIPIVPPQLIRAAADMYRAAGLPEEAGFLDRVTSAANVSITDPKEAPPPRPANVAAFVPVGRWV